MFVDIVFGGFTFSNLFKFLFEWSEELQGCSWSALRERIKVIAIRETGYCSKHESPGIVHNDSWIRALGAEYLDKSYRMRSTGRVTQLWIDPEFWYFMGNQDGKPCNSYHPRIWGLAESRSISRPKRYSIVPSLTLAYRMYILGKTSRDAGKQLTKAIRSKYRERIQRSSWLRDWVLLASGSKVRVPNVSELQLLQKRHTQHNLKKRGSRSSPSVIQQEWDQRTSSSEQAIEERWQSLPPQRLRDKKKKESELEKRSRRQKGTRKKRQEALKATIQQSLLDVE